MCPNIRIKDPNIKKNDPKIRNNDCNLKKMDNINGRAHKNISITRSEVEVLEERLLDCTSSKSSGKEVAELGSAEKCMYEYELTLSFQATMGR